MTGDDVAGELGDGVVVKHPGGGGDDGTHGGLMLAGALGLREKGESAVLFRGETKSHGHDYLIPEWWHNDAAPHTSWGGIASDRGQLT